MTEVIFPAWQLLTLGLGVFGSFCGVVFVAWKMISDERQGKAMGETEKAILQLRAELPIHYVRKEDWVRNQTIIEAKLDALANKLDGGCNNG